MYYEILYQFSKIIYRKTILLYTEILYQFYNTEILYQFYNTIFSNTIFSNTMFSNTIFYSNILFQYFIPIFYSNVIMYFLSMLLNNNYSITNNITTYNIDQNIFELSNANQLI